VVLTSAFGAICAGHKSMTRPFNETDWSDLTGTAWAYQKSKTLSERAAWDFIAREGRGLELSAVNPTAVLGPVLGADYSHSIRLIKNLMDGQPGCPKINSGFVDVRDVADLHLRAMTHPAAKGERFLAIAGESMDDRGREGVAAAHGGRCRQGADAGAAKLVDTPRRPDGPDDERGGAPARRQPERDQRKGDPPARLGAASERRGHCRDRRKPDPAWLAS
jgi:nucleoside-diphosphate-sugar epimerase